MKKKSSPKSKRKAEWGVERYGADEQSDFPWETKPEGRHWTRMARHRRKKEIHSRVEAAVGRPERFAW